MLPIIGEMVAIAIPIAPLVNDIKIKSLIDNLNTRRFFDDLSKDSLLCNSLYSSVLLKLLLSISVWESANVTWISLIVCSNSILCDLDIVDNSIPSLGVLICN